MPTKRRLTERTQLPRIDTRAIDLFERIEEIRASDSFDEIEGDGGRRREYLNCCVELDRRLGIFPHQWGVADVPSTGPLPEGCRDEFHSFEGAQQLRRALQAAVRERRQGAAAAIQRTKAAGR